ncbi:MAG TPA: hypothetical protein VMF86_07015 [Stellaceae bacterium]|nr:hypothetical protein [Stellaceae bacterium]
MMMRLGMLALCLAAFAFQQVRANSVVVAPWARSGFWLRHAGETGPYAHTLYGPSNPAGTWHIAQWHTPGPDMTPFARVACPAGDMDCFLAQSPDFEALQFTRNGTIHVRLSSHGDRLPCTGGYLKQELDSFLEPTTTDNYPGYPSSWHSVNLASISSLTLNATVTTVVLRVPKRQPCGQATLTDVLVAAVFSDRVAHQTLFYQLIIAQAKTANHLRHPYFYDRENPFGYDDLLSTYGIYPNGIPYRRPTTLHIDLLPKIAALITAGEHGIDPIVQHWTTGGLYVGHLIYGNLSATTKWAKVSLIAERIND